LVHQKIIKHFRKTKFNEELEKCFEEINCLERQLSDDKYLILKFFLHISEKEQEVLVKEIKKKGILLIFYEY
jgi:polyphosphate kinase 2 (PPK2 family)